MLNVFYISAKDLSDLQEAKYITLGMAYTDSFLSSEIAKYNNNSTNHKVKIIDYSKYNDERFYIPEMGAASQLNFDIISENAPDMLITSGFTNADNLKQKDCFVDLYDYIEKPDFLPNILEMNEINGKLYSLPLSFYIDTFVGKSEYVGFKENWTIDDLISAYNKSPQDMELMQKNDKKSIIEKLLYGNLENFVDYKNKSCSFDSQEMIKLLDFTDNFENISTENDKFLLKNTLLHSFEDFHNLQACIFNNEDITFVGYPSTDNSGAIFKSDISFSIFQFSSNKSECWDFIKTFFTDDAQYSLDDFPVNKNAFYKKADSTMKKNIDTMSENEKNRYIDYICNIDKFLVCDLQIYIICMEEINLFLSGDSTPQKTAKMIQNRVNIYINE